MIRQRYKLSSIAFQQESGLRQQELQTLVAAIRLQQITIATGDRAVSIGGSADDAVIVTGDHNVVITGTGAEVLRDLMGKRPRAEKLLLQAVKGEVTSRLKQSLHHAILIQLGMEAQPEQVQRPWDSDIKIGNQTFEPILDDWNILQVFYEVQGKLLILGNPGSGKTTTLLELAQALCDRAEQDMEFPIPILFNLSTWKDNEQLLQNWLVEELKSKYGVRKDIAAKWIGEAALLPMLDGLDELASVRQEFCIKQINKLLESESRPEFLVVCSRWEEYNIKTAKLHLNGAVFLQPLEAVKICNYLVGVKKEGLWQIIKTNPSLLELVKTPLLLNITILGYQDTAIGSKHQSNSDEITLEYLLDSYIYRMLERTIKSNVYLRQDLTSQQIKLWLIWLSRQLEQAVLIEFLIEKLQPDWLPDEYQKWMYKLSCGVISGLFGGAIYGLAFGFIFGVDGAITMAISGGISFAISVGLDAERIAPIETWNFSEWSWKSFFQVVDYPKGAGKGITLPGMITFLITSSFLSGFSGAEIEIKRTPNQGIWKSVANAGTVALISGGFGWLLGWFLGLFTSNQSFQLFLSLFFSLALGLTNGLNLGGKACIQHFTLRLILYLHGLIPWNYARFLDYCTDRLLLQRVGGRYRFIHRLLQEHFAAMPLENIRDDR